MKCPNCGYKRMELVTVGGLTLTRRLFRCPKCGYQKVDEIKRESIARSKGRGYK